MKKSYTIHVGAYFTADITITAENQEEAQAIADNYDFGNANFECADITNVEVTED